MLPQQKPRSRQYIRIIVNNQDRGAGNHRQTVALRVFEIDHSFTKSNNPDLASTHKLLFLLNSDLARGLHKLWHEQYSDAFETIRHGPEN